MPPKNKKPSVRAGLPVEVLDHSIAVTAPAFSGFEAQRNLDQKEKETKATIESLTIKQLKGDIFQLKYWWVILLINLAVTIIVAWLTKGWK